MASGTLLATDLLLLVPAPQRDAVRQNLEAAGWITHLAANGWLLLDRPVEPPVPRGGVLRGEAACCASILQRHPGEGVDEEAVRCLARAQEMGRDKVEQACRTLHRALAEKLRRHETIPAGLLPYLQAAAEEEEGTL